MRGRPLHIDVVELEHFYSTHLGQMVQRSLRLRLRSLWPSVTNASVLGLGFPNPVLRPFTREAERVVVAMPATQGADWWRASNERGNATSLVFDDQLPFGDLSMDRIIAMHYLESTESLTATLQEIWRVLAPEGRFIAIIPNRSGLWARVETTPYAHGRPFSRGQFERTLRTHRFGVERHIQALYFPPVRTRLLLNFFSPLERIRSGIGIGFGGVHIVEAVKHVHSITPVSGLRQRVRVPLPRPRPATQPTMSGLVSRT